MADLTNQLQTAAGASTGVASDADFENTVLLLHGDGTNGAQNNTFIDSSTNNFTITRNGNTTQGTFSPFSKPDGRWGNYFDGTGDNLSVAANSAFLYTGDFTVELWVYPTRFVDFEFLFGTGGSGTQDQANIYANGTYVYFDGTNSVTSPTLQLNAWNHIAVTRTGTTIRAYANGVSGTSQTKSGNLGSSANAFRIGERSDGAQDFNGYISNLRVVNGTAVYTGATYTVPTAPLTAITNTSLLTCQSNRFIDNSSNNFAITRNGDVRVTPFSPFPITTAYSTSVNGGAGYFDGSGDYLTAPSSQSFNLSSGNWTIEGWTYGVALANDNRLFSLEGSSTSHALIRPSTNGSLEWNKVGTGALITSSSGVSPAGSWTHFALVSNSGTITLYVNGVSAGTTATYPDNSATQFTIAATAVRFQTSNTNAYLSDIRVVKGTAVYTTGFTPPTAPLTAISNTELLCNFTNAGIFDNTGFNALETVGNAQIDTTTKKYGTGSMEFDGSGDYIDIPSNPYTAFGSGDLTVECWIYFNSLPSTTAGAQIIDFRGGGVNTNTAPCFVLVNSSGTYNLRLESGSTIVADRAVTVSTGTWYHVALVRSGGTGYIFLNGTLMGTSFSWTTSYTGSYLTRIGAYTSSVSTLNGFIDDLRVTKGIARYTSNFTPPTAALPDLGA